MEYIADNLYTSLYMFVPRIFATVNFIVFSGREIAWFRLLQIYNAAAAEQRESPVRDQQQQQPAKINSRGAEPQKVYQGKEIILKTSADNGHGSSCCCCCWQLGGKIILVYCLLSFYEWRWRDCRVADGVFKPGAEGKGIAADRSMVDPPDRCFIVATWLLE